MVASYNLFASLPLVPGIQYLADRFRFRRTQPRAAAGIDNRMQQMLVGEIGNLRLSSDQPGTLLVTWDAADPAPADYRVNWAASTGDFPTYREADGNAYSQDNGILITGLTSGAEYWVRVRSRYLDENGRELRRGPWTSMAHLTVADDLDRASEPGFVSGLSDNLCAEAEMIDVRLRAKVRAPAYRVLPGRATLRSAASSRGNGRSNGDSAEEPRVLAGSAT